MQLSELFQREGTEFVKIPTSFITVSYLESQK